MLFKITQKLAFYSALVCLTASISTVSMHGVSKIHESRDEFYLQQKFDRTTDFCMGLALLSCSSSLGFILISSLFVPDEDI
jgi:peptidoglycan biosynthesis protein MviN/MurJ (putative lipid II flippase)